MNIEIANRLLQYRKSKGMSQEELAAKIGVSRQAVSKWERAEASPDTDNLIALAEVYEVSLDRLLKGESASESTCDSEENENSSAEPEENYEGNNETSYRKYDKVSFKNGIHIDSKDGDSVHISFQDGIHVHDKHGTNVDIDGSGVHVDENGKNRVYTDENGEVYVDETLKQYHHKDCHNNVWYKFPFFILPIIAFLLWGISGVCFGFALSWIVFLTIPLYYSAVSAIVNRNANNFAYPVLVVIAYILFGYFNVCGGWAFGWIAFLTIPIYYCICSMFKSENHKDCA